MTNERISATFEKVAALLEQQEASTHRVRAWREAAQAIREHPRALAEIFRDLGRAGLEAVPRVGPRLASVLIEMLQTGRCSALDRLRGDTGKVLERLPGIGPELAARIRDELGIETLEELEAAAHDGRLDRVPGFGARRIAGLRDVLATRLGRARPRLPPEARPPIDVMLAVDGEYRRAAEAGELRTIAPHRFNPAHEAWLPVMHLERDGWAFTALYSNTARAHELGRTRDWVILYFHRLPHEAEGQATVVTEWRGHLHGRRVVRGRERECAEYYGNLDLEPRRADANVRA